MKVVNHIRVLNKRYGQIRDELNRMVEEGHIHKSFISLDRTECELSQLIKDVELQDFVKGEHREKAIGSKQRDNAVRIADWANSDLRRGRQAIR